MANAPKRRFMALKSAWYVWLFPMFAVLICVYLTYDYFEKKGPVIRIHFEDGSAIQASKTRVRFRGVTIGMVKNIVVSDDNKEVIAEVALEKEAEHFAVEGTKYWVVMPKVGFQGITGLETIFEGTYIAATPGKKDGAVEYDFKGRLSSDSSEALEDTTAYHLETNNVDSISSGDTVTFRGLVVGSVTKVVLAKGAQTVHVQINIQNKYVRLIRANTAFWRKVAVQANLGLFNSEVKINSLESLLKGGIEFSTPNEPGEVSKGGAHFPLASGPPKDFEKWNARLE
jgi:paraquat-inducible protein B